jgi:hypothetical protein
MSVETGSVATLSFLSLGYGLRWRERMKQYVQGQASACYSTGNPCILRNESLSQRPR